MANTIKLKRASGSDPSASDLATGELAIRTSNCKLFSKNDSGSAIGIVAGSADTLTTARTIAGVSFDGSANISLNNNAITNGAGFLADIVSDSSPQLGGNLDVQARKLTTSTSNGNIQVEPDGSGVFEVRGAGGNDGTLQLNCSAQSHGIKLKSPAHSAGASYTLTFPDDVQNGKFLTTDGSGNLSWSVDGSSFTSLNGSNISSGTVAAARVATLNQDTTGSAATLTTARTIAGVSFDGSANISLNNNAITNGAGYITTVADTTIAPSEIRLADNEKIYLGNSTDLGFHHDPSVGNVISNAFCTLVIRDTTGTIGAKFANSGQIELNHNGTKKLEVVSGGISLTGGAAANITALSDGSTITIDMATASHHSVTLGGNRTFAAPSNQAVGQAGSIFITQDGTGSRTASFNSAFKFVGGTAPTLSTAASAVDRIDYVIKSSNVIHCVISLDVK